MEARRHPARVGGEVGAGRRVLLGQESERSVELSPRLLLLVQGGHQRRIETPASTREEHRAERFEPGWEEPTEINASRFASIGSARLSLDDRADAGDLMDAKSSLRRTKRAIRPLVFKHVGSFGPRR